MESIKASPHTQRNRHLEKQEIDVLTEPAMAHLLCEWTWPLAFGRRMDFYCLIPCSKGPVNCKILLLNM